MATKFAQTYHVTVANALKGEFGGKSKFALDHHRIPSIGDGNCSVNSFGLALIDLVKSNQEASLRFDFNHFLTYLRNPANLAILRNRIGYYSEHFEDLAGPLIDFLELIQKPILNRAQFFQYIKDAKTREAIAAIHVGLAPALREVGARSFLSKLNRIQSENNILDDAYTLFNDGVFAGGDILGELAHDYFGINLNILRETHKDGGVTHEAITPSNTLLNAPTVTLLSVPNHWDYLAPTTGGLVNDLRAAAAVAPTSNLASPIENNDKNSYLLRCLELSSSIANSSNLSVVKAELHHFAGALKQFNTAILKDTTSPLSHDDYKAFADVSANCVETVKQKLNITKEKLNSMQLNVDAQALIINKAQILASENTDTQEGRDAALARQLQNEEILSFLQTHYEVLKPEGQKLPAPSAAIVPATQARKP